MRNLLWEEQVTLRTWCFFILHPFHPVSEHPAAQQLQPGNMGTQRGHIRKPQLPAAVSCGFELWLFKCNLRHPCWQRASKGDVCMRTGDEMLGSIACPQDGFWLGATKIHSTPLYSGDRTLSSTPSALSPNGCSQPFVQEC